MMHGLLQFLSGQGKGMFKDSHPELGFQNAENSGIQHCLIRFAGGKLLFQFRGISLRHGKLHVHPGGKAAQAGVSHGFTDPLVPESIGNTAVV